MESLSLSPSASSRHRAPIQGHCVPTQASSSVSSLDQILTVPKTTDIAIVGGGASGLAVVVELVKRVKAGYKQIRSIMLIEKRGKIGPGLAYSDASTGLILNMHSDTMGLCPINAMQFSEWVRANATHLSKHPFPTRYLYGQYLTQLAEETMNDAKKLGIDFHAVNREVIDIQKFSEEPGFALTMGTGEHIQAKEVVLALGNFCATVNPQLRGNANYFRCPWPAEKLRAIDRDTDVLVMGSRLTAIDVANALVANGHVGNITFVSRSARLPSVQGARKVFGRKFDLSNLARELEEGESGNGGTLGVLIEKMKDLIDENYPEAATRLFEPGNKSVIETLRKDVSEAERGAIMWQVVLWATTALTERYWNTFTVEEKQRWLKEFNSKWVTHRHAMPLDNGKKILELLESGQLRVVKGSKAFWDEDLQRFVLEQKDDEGRSVEGNILIESLGQEFDTSKINSPLLQTLLTSGLLESHPVSGIDVDFNTFKTASGIYAIGSLTKGVHFYVIAADRVTVHASRIADSLIHLPHRKQLHIALFVGSDLFSNLMLSKLIPQLLARGHCPFIFLPKDTGYSRPASAKRGPYDLEKLHFWERNVLQETIIPFLGATPNIGAEFMTVQQLASHYGLLVQSVPDVNAQSFVETLKENYIDIGISLRCNQRFSSNTIAYFNSPSRYLLNLHRGQLPEYQGVMTTFRAMGNGDTDVENSLHHIDEHFDTGDVIEARKGEIDYGKCMLVGMKGLLGVDVEMVLDAVEKGARGGNLREGNVVQDKKRAKYWKFPTEVELNMAREKGVELVDEDGKEVFAFLMECYGGDDEERKDELRGQISDAWLKWKLENFEIMD